MNEKLDKAGLIESINQPAELWFATAIAQFRFASGCCQQVSGCCARVSRQISIDELVKEMKKSLG